MCTWSGGDDTSWTDGVGELGMYWMDGVGEGWLVWVMGSLEW